MIKNMEKMKIGRNTGTGGRNIRIMEGIRLFVPTIYNKEIESLKKRKGTQGGPLYIYNKLITFSPNPS